MNEAAVMSDWNSRVDPNRPLSLLGGDLAVETGTSPRRSVGSTGSGVLTEDLHGRQRSFSHVDSSDVQPRHRPEPIALNLPQELAWRQEVDWQLSKFLYTLWKKFSRWCSESTEDRVTRQQRELTTNLASLALSGLPPLADEAQADPDGSSRALIGQAGGGRRMQDGRSVEELQKATRNSLKDLLPSGYRCYHTREVYAEAARQVLDAFGITPDELPTRTQQQAVFIQLQRMEASLPREASRERNAVNYLADAVLAEMLTRVESCPNAFTTPQRVARYNDLMAHGRQVQEQTLGPEWAAYQDAVMQQRRARVAGDLFDVEGLLHLDDPVLRAEVEDAVSTGRGLDRRLPLDLTNRLQGLENRQRQEISRLLQSAGPHPSVDAVHDLFDRLEPFMESPESGMAQPARAALFEAAGKADRAGQQAIVQRLTARVNQRTPEQMRGNLEEEIRTFEATTQFLANAGGLTDAEASEACLDLFVAMREKIDRKDFATLRLDVRPIAKLLGMANAVFEKRCPPPGGRLLVPGALRLRFEALQQELGQSAGVLLKQDRGGLPALFRRCEELHAQQHPQGQAPPLGPEDVTGVFRAVLDLQLEIANAWPISMEQRLEAIDLCLETARQFKDRVFHDQNGNPSDRRDLPEWREALRDLEHRRVVGLARFLESEELQPDQLDPRFSRRVGRFRQDLRRYLRVENSRALFLTSLNDRSRALADLPILWDEQRFPTVPAVDGRPLRISPKKLNHAPPEKLSTYAKQLSADHPDVQTLDRQVEDYLRTNNMPDPSQQGANAPRLRFSRFASVKQSKIQRIWADQTQMGTWTKFRAVMEWILKELPPEERAPMYLNLVMNSTQCAYGVADTASAYYVLMRKARGQSTGADRQVGDASVEVATRQETANQLDELFQTFRESLDTSERLARRVIGDQEIAGDPAHAKWHVRNCIGKDAGFASEWLHDTYAGGDPMQRRHPDGLNQPHNPDASIVDHRIARQDKRRQMNAFLSLYTPQELQQLTRTHLEELMSVSENRIDKAYETLHASHEAERDARIRAARQECEEEVRRIRTGMDRDLAALHKQVEDSLFGLDPVAPPNQRQNQDRLYRADDPIDANDSLPGHNDRREPGPDFETRRIESQPTHHDAMHQKPPSDEKQQIQQGIEAMNHALEQFARRKTAGEREIAGRRAEFEQRKEQILAEHARNTREPVLRDEARRTEEERATIFTNRLIEAFFPENPEYIEYEDLDESSSNRHRSVMDGSLALNQSNRSESSGPWIPQMRPKGLTDQGIQEILIRLGYLEPVPENAPPLRND